MKKTYRIEIVWNREFDFVPFGPFFDTCEKAREYGEYLLNMGDGASVKKYRIIEEEV